jgi:Tfp pilus assembly protein PilN
MIRVNLIGSARKGGKRKGKGGITLPDIPNVGILLFVLLLVAELAGLYLWQTNAAHAADKLQGKLSIKKLELTSMQKTKEDLVAIKAETDKLEAQKKLFDEMFADKVGPVNALTYLSFMLEPRDEAVLAGEDLRAMEAAGWRVQWDARKAWFTSFREAAGEVTLVGEALDHEDVAEVQRRLEASPYFREMKLVFQERKKDDRLGVDYIEFQVKGSLVYLIVPSKPAKPAEPDANAPIDGDAGSTDGDAGAGRGDASGPATPSLPKTVTPTGHAEVDAKADVDAKVDASDAAEPDVTAEVVPVAAPIVPKPAAAAPAPARREEPMPSAGEAAAPPPAVPASDAPAANPAAGEKE